MSRKRRRITHIISGDLWAGAEVAVAGLLPGLQLEYDVSALLFNEGVLSRRLRQKGIEVSVIQEGGSIRDIPMLTKICRVLREKRSELVHTHDYKETVLGVPAGKLAGVDRFVCTQHGAPEQFRGFARLKNGLYLLFDRLVIGCCVDRIISVSEDLRRRLIVRYPPERVVTVHNGIELTTKRPADRVERKRQLGIPSSRKLVGTVGRLTPVKGIHHLLKAARLILKARQDVVFVIAGDGPLKNELRKMARELEIHDSVLFLGFREDVIEVMSMMDVFVLTSLHEGIPLSLLEAMGLGLPVVATKVGGIPEVIEDGRSGILVQPGSAEAIAEAILDMLSARAEAIGSQGRKRVLEEFSTERTVRRTADIYRQLLGNTA
jgi:glycosyltransferase involved in cell wall biosynthesis